MLLDKSKEVSTIIGKIITPKNDRCIVPSIHVGEGTLENGKKIEIATSWGSEPIIIFEGKYFVLEWQEICELADKAGLFKQDDKKEVI